MRCTRREFNRRLGGCCAGVMLVRDQETPPAPKHPVVLARGENRGTLVQAAVTGLGGMAFGGRTVYLKGNFNSADPHPAATHPDTLAAVVGLLRERGCKKIILVERSGMGNTADIWDKLKIPELAARLQIQLLPLDGTPSPVWRREPLPGSHWKSGVEVPAFLTPECCVVQITNIKTHRFGGQFSGSLKNSLGLVAKHDSRDPAINYMAELHESRYQRLMIAEVNQIYTPSLVVMDAMHAFTEGGPERGELASPHIVAASADRVAMDAVGVALLRIHGAGAPLKRGDIFALDQIKRAAELDLGAKSAAEIDLRAGNPDSRLVVDQISAILTNPPPDKD